MIRRCSNIQAADSEKAGCSSPGDTPEASHKAVLALNLDMPFIQIIPRGNLHIISFTKGQVALRLL